MNKIKIQIGGNSYEVEIADTDATKEQGLQNRETLDQDKGMLFIFDEQEEISFWMENTTIPLDIIFIDEDLIVIQVLKGEPNSKTLLEGEATFVLELNQDSGIKQGDELEFEPEKDNKKTDKMLVLNSKGESQMELDGGERIFSRKHTKTLIQFAKKAAITDKESDYRNLGKRMFKFLKEQSETKPEYVKSKN